MAIKLPADLDLDAARAAFVARQGCRDLADAPSPTAVRAPLKELLSGAANDAGPVPIGLLRLRRHAARARALGVSLAARAAHTAEDIARKIGPFTLQLIVEDDVTFLTISGPDDKILPTRLDAFLEAMQRHITLDLPPAIGGTVQLGLAPSSETGKDLLNILAHPEAEIVLS